jgi:hypothetical protein
MNVLYRNERPKYLIFLMNRHCDTDSQEDYFDYGELNCEARHRLVSRRARDLLPFILRKSPSKSRIFENEV